MADLTITIDDELLARAESRAREKSTSVGALVCGYLEGIAGQPNERDAIKAFLDLAERCEAGSGLNGRTWTRGDLDKR